VESGGLSSTETALENYLTALRGNGGQGLLYWEPEVYAPLASYSMGDGTPPPASPPRL
jgi:arabinogalactan endo-1,4-beta-galactosidase